ncbi:MAG: hypothetical protein GY703_00790 [Gammaproteobacteria bacterium]|nr:hypothetical protein [Gammaproteobacteria bacterium]
MGNSHQSCSVCRFLRSFAFSAIGAGVLGFSALALGFDRDMAIAAAFVGALGLVSWASRRFDNVKKD